MIATHALLLDVYVNTADLVHEISCHFAGAMQGEQAGP